MVGMDRMFLGEPERIEPGIDPARAALLRAEADALGDEWSALRERADEVEGRMDALRDEARRLADRPVWGNWLDVFRADEPVATVMRPGGGVPDKIEFVWGDRR